MKEEDKIIFQTRPYMPPRAEFEAYLDRIWASGQLTNDGPIHAEFEEALCHYLGVEYISLFTNGTLALLFALKVLGLKGEVITTPFTSVATMQAIYWNNLKPVFTDISMRDLNITAENIERAITPDTSAVLPVHVFGNPCDLTGIRQLAERHHLKTIYDAAHCFGVKAKGISVCSFGDLAVLSFHATKVFNSFEGGAVVSHDSNTKKALDALKILRLDKGLMNNPVGLNAKLNEVQAAFGLVQLKHIDKVIEMRRQATVKYLELLSGIDGIRFITGRDETMFNYSYLPVVVNPHVLGISRDELAEKLKQKNIITRKYFYPLVSDFPEFSHFKTTELPVACEMAANILCLPLFHDISHSEITRIVNLIKQCAGKNK